MVATVTLSEGLKRDIAKALWSEYLRVDEWPLQTEEGAHGAKCAIRCCATRLGVYPEFVAKDKDDAGTV